MKSHKPLFKCDFFGIGDAIGGAASATGQIIAAQKALEGTKYAADQSYQGALSTNNANIQIANDVNATNIQNTKDTNATNIQLNKQTNEANRYLAEQQNQWNIEQWNRQNEYNSPAHQVELYRQAGLNPSQLAGAGWSEAQQLNSAPLANQQSVQIQSPQATALPTLTNPSEAASQILAQGNLQAAQYYAGVVDSAAKVAEGLSRIKKTNSDTKLNESQLRINAQEIRRMKNLNFKIEQMTPIEIAQSTYTLRSTIQSLDNMRLDYDLKKLDIEAHKLSNRMLYTTSQYFSQFTQKQFEKLCNEVDLSFEQVRNLYDANEFYRKYGRTREGAAQLASAMISADSSRYAADKSFQGTIYSSNNSYLGTLYASDNSLRASMYSADKSNEASHYASDQSYNADIRKFKAIGAGIVAGAAYSIGKTKLGTVFRHIRNFEKARKNAAGKYYGNTGQGNSINNW